MTCALCSMTSGDDNTVATMSFDINPVDESWDGMSVDDGTMKLCAAHADLLREAYADSL